MSFADLGLCSETVQAVEEIGYTQPTPIQAEAIPLVLRGRDILGIAQTGTGKTASFTLPMIDILASGRAKARMPRSIILAPTRELASQVADNFTQYGKHHNLNMALLIGGEAMNEQEKKLDRGVDVLIATPGRLFDHMERGSILLSDVKILVIDEADRMLDMGFMPDVEKIVSRLPKFRQTLFFSATMDKTIRNLADNFLINPKQIEIARENTTAENVTQTFYSVYQGDKRKALRQLLQAEDVKTAFIFCNRKKDVDILGKSMEKHGIAAATLHGDMPQSVRSQTLEQFKGGAISILICSDIAARGIDVDSVSHVFNFDVPYNAEDYVHRIGRTARAGKSGKAYTLVAEKDTDLIDSIKKLINQNFVVEPLEGYDTPNSDDADAIDKRRKKKKRKEKRTSSGGDKRSRSKRTDDSQQQQDDTPPPPQQQVRSRRYNNRYDDPQAEIMEMTHADGVVAFGDHTPEFILRDPFTTPPAPRRKPRYEEPEDAPENQHDSTDEIVDDLEPAQQDTIEKSDTDSAAQEIVPIDMPPAENNTQEEIAPKTPLSENVVSEEAEDTTTENTSDTQSEEKIESQAEEEKEEAPVYPPTEVVINL